MRIAICDDDPQVLIQLTEILEAYRQETKAGFTYSTFSEAMTFLDEVRGGGYDLLLLDVLMPMVNGMQAAHEVRSFDETIKIVFLTSSPEFAVESYAVKAHSYLLKPCTRDALFPILDKLFAERIKTEDSFPVKFQNGIASILFSNLSFVEVMNKTLCFHLCDGSMRELVAPLADFEAMLLSRPEFVKVHRAFIVNLWQIQELSTTNITTYTGKTIPISRRLYPQVRDIYMKHLFVKKGVR